MFTKDFAISRILTFLLEKALVIMQNYVCLLVEIYIIIHGKLQSRGTSNKQTKFSPFNKSSYLSSRYVHAFVKIVKGRNLE